MGFFDRFSSSKGNPPPDIPSAPAPAPSPETARGDGIHARLLAANEKLKARDLPGAMSIYEELVQSAGDRPDVLVTISADLGTAGCIPQIVELVAPRYDADKHGPATGINLLQAYLAMRNTTAAQHLLDILFALNRPELEERLYGFSNALAELIEAEKRGELPPPPAIGQPAVKTINLVSISRPIWSYGLENLPAASPPARQGRQRRVAFVQLSTLGLDEETVLTKTALPEDALARFTRGFPLWLSETFYYSPHYNPIAVLAMVGRESYAIYPIEWKTGHITQLSGSSDGELDYVFTGALQQQGETIEIVIRLWEVKKLRERKQFTATYTPATADAALAALHGQILQFMEWRQDPAAPAYAAPASPAAWCETLGASLSFFLAEKETLPVAQITDPAGSLARAAAGAAHSERESFACLTLAARARRLDLDAALPPDLALAPTPLVEQAKQTLAT